MTKFNNKQSKPPSFNDQIILILTKCFIVLRTEYWNWMDLKMSPDKKWLAGGFPVNDHEIENTGPKEVTPTNYVDMSPLGNWIHNIPTFASNATEDKQSCKNLSHLKRCVVNK